MTPVFAHGRLRLYLLKLLDESPRHGYDVIRELEDRFMGMYAPSAGTVYPRLARLEAEGLVTHEEVEGRKVYRITEEGRLELDERQGDLDDLEEEIAGSVRDLAREIRVEVRGSAQDLKAELRSAARDMRRQGRHQARTAQQAAKTARKAQHPGQDEVVRLVDGFRNEVFAAISASAPTDEDVATVKDVLDVALQELREVLGGQGSSGVGA